MTIETFIGYEFGCFPFGWMFHCRKLNSRVNKFYESALRTVYQDHYWISGER